jgi:hypothetical protein
MSGSVSRRREILLSGVTLLCTLLLIFVVGEVIARFVVPPFTTRFDAETGSVHIPNEIVRMCTSEFCNEVPINSMGHIDTEFRGGAPAVMVLGDSFMAAEQVSFESSLHQQLEGMIQREHGGGEVLNLGHDGFGPGQYFILQKKYSHLKPDVVLFFTYLGNDFKNLNNALNQVCQPYFEVDHGVLVQLPVTCAPSGWVSLVKKYVGYSRLIVYIYTQLKTIGEGGKLQQKADFIPVDYLAYEVGNEEYEKSFELYAAIVHAAQDYARAGGAEFVVVLIPPREMVYPERWEKIKEAYPALRGRRLDSMLPYTHAVNVCESVRCVDLLEVFRQAGNEPLYYEIDGHWNARGHEVAAGAVYAYIDRHVLSKRRW